MASAKISDRNMLSARTSFGLKVWSEETVSAVVFASDICAEQAQWIQGLFCLVNGDIAPDAETVGKYVGVTGSYDKIVSARNSNLAEAKGCEVSALRGVWAKGTISKGVKVLCELRPYNDIMGMDSADGMEIINAQVPQAEILTYATDLTSITGGLGSFTISYSHYEEVPNQIAEKIIAEANVQNG